MELTSLPVEIEASRNTGNGQLHTFRFRPQSLPAGLETVVNALPEGAEIAIPDTGDGDCVREARRTYAGLEIKRGCHGAAGSWRSASYAETIGWLSRGVSSGEALRSECSLWWPANEC